MECSGHVGDLGIYFSLLPLWIVGISYDSYMIPILSGVVFLQMPLNIQFTLFHQNDYFCSFSTFYSYIPSEFLYFPIFSYQFVRSKEVLNELILLLPLLSILSVWSEINFWDEYRWQKFLPLWYMLNCMQRRVRIQEKHALCM